MTETPKPKPEPPAPPPPDWLTAQRNAIATARVKPKFYGKRRWP